MDPTRIVCTIATARSSEQLAPPGNYMDPRSRRMATKVAWSRVDPGRLTQDIWVFDFDRQTTTRITSHPLLDASPVWSRDSAQTPVSHESDGTDKSLYPRIWTQGPIELSSIMSGNRRSTLARTIRRRLTGLRTGGTSSTRVRAERASTFSELRSSRTQTRRHWLDQLSMKCMAPYHPTAAAWRSVPTSRVGQKFMCNHFRSAGTDNWYQPG